VVPYSNAIVNRDVHREKQYWWSDRTEEEMQIDRSKGQLANADSDICESFDPGANGAVERDEHFEKPNVLSRPDRAILQLTWDSTVEKTRRETSTTKRLVRRDGRLAAARGIHFHRWAPPRVLAAPRRWETNETGVLRDIVRMLPLSSRLAAIIHCDIWDIGTALENGACARAGSMVGWWSNATCLSRHSSLDSKAWLLSSWRFESSFT
jgi:hypothetical protein